MAGQQQKLVADYDIKVEMRNGLNREDRSISPNVNQDLVHRAVFMLNKRTNFGSRTDDLLYHHSRNIGFFMNPDKYIGNKAKRILLSMGISTHEALCRLLIKQFDKMYKAKWFIGVVDNKQRRQLYELLKREGAISSIYRKDVSLKRKCKIEFWTVFPTICNVCCGGLFKSWFSLDSEFQMFNGLDNVSKLADYISGFPDNVEAAFEEPETQDKIINAVTACLNRFAERMKSQATQKFEDIGMIIKEAWEAFVSAFRSACSAVGEFFRDWADRIKAMFCVAFMSLSNELSDMPGISDLFAKFSDFTGMFVMFEDVQSDSQFQAGPEHLIQWVCAMIAVLGNFDNDTRLLITKSFNMMPDIGQLFKKAYEWMMYVVTGNERYVFGDLSYKILEISSKIDTWIEGPEAISSFQNCINRRKVVLAARTSLRRMKLSAARNGFTAMNRDEGMMIQTMLSRLDRFITTHTSKEKTKSISRKPPLNINLVGDRPGAGKSFISVVFTNLCLAMKAWYEEVPREFGSRVAFDISNSDYDDGIEEAIVLVISEFLQNAQKTERSAEVLNFIKRVSNEKLPLNMSVAEKKGKYEFKSEFLLTNSNVMPDCDADMGVASTSAMYRRGIWVEVVQTGRFDEEKIIEKPWIEVITELDECWNMRVYCDKKFLDGKRFRTMAEDLFPKAYVETGLSYDQISLTFGQFVRVLTYYYVFYRQVSADESAHTFTDHVDFFNRITGMQKKKVEATEIPQTVLSKQTQSIHNQLERGEDVTLDDGLLSTLKGFFSNDNEEGFEPREMSFEFDDDSMVELESYDDSEFQCQDLESQCGCPALDENTRNHMFEEAYKILVELELIHIDKENRVICSASQFQMGMYVMMYIISRKISPAFAREFCKMPEELYKASMYKLVLCPAFKEYLKSKGKFFHMTELNKAKHIELVKEHFPRESIDPVSMYYYTNKYHRYFVYTDVESQFNMNEDIDWLAILGTGLLSLICVGIVIAIAFAIKAIVDSITAALETRYEGNPSVPNKNGRSVVVPVKGDVYESAKDSTYQSNKLDDKQLNNLTVKLRQNHVRVTLHYYSGSIVTTHATFLRAYTMCINKHVMRESVEYISIQPLNCAFGTGQTVVERSQYILDEETYNDDVVLIHFKPGTSNLNMRADLTKYLFEPNKADREYEVLVYENNKFVQRGRISQVGDFHCDIGHFMNLYSVRGYQTKKGDCGRLYIVKDGNSYKILGMHAGRHNDLAAMVVPLDRRDLHTKKSDSQYESLVCKGTKLDRDVKPIIVPNLEQCFPGAVALGKLPGYFYSAVGPIEHKPSVIHKYLPPEIPMLTEPIVRNKDNVFAKKALNKDRNCYPLPREFVQIVDTDPLSLTEGYLKDHMPYKHGMQPNTDWNEIAFGSDLAHGVNPTTSGGSYDMFSKKRSKKSDMMEKGELAAEFIEALDEDDKLLRQGIYPIPLFNQAAKAELLPPEKEFPRPFSVAGLKVDVLYRKYIGKGLQVLGINPSFRAVLRYNPHGYANEYVRKVIHKFPNLVELDVKTMDDSISPVFSHLFALWWCETVCGFEKKSPDYIATYTILSNITNYMFFMKDGVYQAAWGLPSGHLVTAVFNAFVNHVILKFMNLCLYPMMKYDECMSFLGLGDDLCGSVNKNCPLINQLSITKIGAMFGLLYTGGDKKPCTTLYQEKVGFLSRKWKTIEGRSVHALKKSSLYGILHWQRKTVSKQEYLTQTMNVVLMESFYHGEEFFNKMRNAIVDSYSKVGYDGVIKDWKYFLNRWNNTYSGGMMNEESFVKIDDELMNWFDNETMTELGQYLY